MNKEEIIKIVTILFHVISFGMLFISISLILDLILRGIEIVGTNEQGLFRITNEGIFSIIACVIGFISIILIVSEWINNQRLKFYLGTILLSESILFVGISLIMILKFNES